MLRLPRFLLRLVLHASVAAVLLVTVFGFVAPPTTAFMLGQRLERGAWPDYRWRGLDEISPYLLMAVVAAEDQHFDTHDGFDIEAIEKAVEHNREGRDVRGASTITQQVAKNLFLWPGRSLVRKGVEALFTAAIEVVWSKRRILEVYVNVAEFGPGIFGAEAAAQRLFGVPASALARRQAALLAAVLPAPRKHDAASPVDHVRKRAAWIEGQVEALGGPAWLERVGITPRGR